MSASIRFLFVDEHVVVANKPSGLLVHRGWDDDDDVAMFRVRDALGAARPSGPSARSRDERRAPLRADREAAAGARSAFEEGRVDKRYLALVRGTPPAEGVIDYAIPKSEDGPRVPAQDALSPRAPLARRSLLARRSRCPRPGACTRSGGTCGTSTIRSSAT